MNALQAQVFVPNCFMAHIQFTGGGICFELKIALAEERRPLPPSLPTYVRTYVIVDFILVIELMRRAIKLSVFFFSSTQSGGSGELRGGELVIRYLRARAYIHSDLSRQPCPRLTNITRRGWKDPLMMKTTGGLPSCTMYVGGGNE